jgi:hypothetical protein
VSPTSLLELGHIRDKESVRRPEVGTALAVEYAALSLDTLPKLESILVNGLRISLTEV